MISDYNWYHKIPLPDGTTTPGAELYVKNWAFISDCLHQYDLKGKSVADIGCRDGLFSFEAEEMGAAAVIAIDNDINPGSEEVASLRGSMVHFRQHNLYAIAALSTYQELFDVVLFFGVLYHLRYPIWGLRCVLHALKTGGLLLIETALYTVPTPHEVIYVPVANSPYEPTSCAFFNEAALRVTLESLGCEVLGFTRQPFGDNDRVARYFVAVRKVRQMTDYFDKYWEGEHDFHHRKQSTAIPKC